MATVSDNFDRGDGVLVSPWASFGAGANPIAIIADQVRGSVSSSAWNGSYRTEVFDNDQFSQMEIWGNPGSNNWIGTCVRTTSNGQNCYYAYYFNNLASGRFELRLGKLISGVATNLTTVPLGAALTSGTQLNLTVVGNTLRLYQNNVQVASAVDSTFTSGEPGIITFGTTGVGDNWSGGDFAASVSASDSWSVSDSASVSLSHPVFESWSMADSAQASVIAIRNSFDSITFSDRAFLGFIPALIDNPSATLTVTTPYKASLAVIHG